MACIHGNDPRSCFVCQTLREADSYTAAPSAGGRRGRASAPADVVGRTAPTPAPRPDRTPAGGAEYGDSGGGSGSRFGFHVAVFALVVLAAAISVWFVAGIIFSLIRVFEILLVAVLAATLGYRVGRVRGRHERQ